MPKKQHKRKLVNINQYQLKVTSDHVYTVPCKKPTTVCNCGQNLPTDFHRASEAQLSSSCTTAVCTNFALILEECSDAHQSKQQNLGYKTI